LPFDDDYVLDGAKVQNSIQFKAKKISRFQLFSLKTADFSACIYF